MASERNQQPPENMTQLVKEVIWLETTADIKRECTSVKEKLHFVREKYRGLDHKSMGHKETNKMMIDWNEDLLTFCKANRRKYMLEDKTMKMTKQRIQDQMMIAQKEEEIEKLQKELKEDNDAKDEALNRLSALQSHLLQEGNPDIADLSDQNRPTNLGEAFRELYDNEWTDAFEFFTEDSDAKHFKDEEAIDMLFAMLKRCNDLCSEALEGQRTELAQLVYNPKYIKTNVTRSASIQKPPVTQKSNQNVTKIDVKVQSLHQKETDTKTEKAQFSKTLPARTSPPETHDKQAGSDGKEGDTNAKTGEQTTGPMADVYEAEQQPGTQPKSNAGDQTINPKLDVPIREFSKKVAAEVLKYVTIADFLPSIKKDEQFPEDVLQNSVVQRYLEKCFHICWLMATQYPPMLIDFETKVGMTFDTNVFEAYTKKGPKIAQVVWPPVHLHKGGPFVSKGCAQGKE